MSKTEAKRKSVITGTFIGSRKQGENQSQITVGPLQQTETV